MSGTGDGRVEAAVRAALRERPMDAVDLARAVRGREPALVARREGSLHAILRAGVRASRLHVAGRSERGLTRYALSPDAEAASPGAVAEPPPVPPEISRAALRVAQGVRDAADRGRVVADAIAHLADLDGARVAPAFGAAKAAQHVVRRADRGRPFVAFPATFGDHVRRLVLHEGPWIVGAVVAFFVLKLWFVDVNVIPSSSMVPTLLEKDRVVVAKVGWGPVPERWRVHTFAKHGTVYVKRCVGLPGERLALVHGDVWVDGSVLRKPDDVREALRLPYATWEFGDVTPPGWARVEADGGVRWRFGWHLPAHGRPEPAAPSGSGFGLRDVYVDLDVERPASGWARLELARTEGLPGAEPLAEAWTLVVAPDGVRLEGVPDVRWKAPAPSAGPTRLSLSTVDGVLRARVGDAAVEIALTTPDAPARIAFVVGGGARPRTVRVDQDLHYSNTHTLGVPEPYGNPKPEDYAFLVPASSVFFLGDNTTNSTDSRNLGMGTIPVDDVIGPVRFRVWPPSRIGRVR